MKNRYQGNAVCLAAFVASVADKLEEEGRYASARHYRSAATSLLSYLQAEDIPLSRITSGTVEGYDAWLRSRGKAPNTVSFYNRALRAILNRHEAGRGTAVFRGFFTGNDATAKRALPLPAVQKLRALSGRRKRLSPELRLTLDLFLFSLYASGISFVDMAFLTPADIRDGYLVYTRRKTHRQLRVKLVPELQEILDRYAAQRKGYLFPFLSKRLSARDNYRRYTSALALYNRRLKALGKELGCPLTSYVARHSWASLAYREVGSPIGAISAALGHASERTTRIYLADLATETVDRLNERVLAVMRKRKNPSLGKRQISGREYSVFQFLMQGFF